MRVLWKSRSDPSWRTLRQVASRGSRICTFRTRHPWRAYVWNRWMMTLVLLSRFPKGLLVHCLGHRTSASTIVSVFWLLVSSWYRSGSCFWTPVVFQLKYGKNIAVLSFTTIFWIPGVRAWYAHDAHAVSGLCPPCTIWVPLPVGNWLCPFCQNTFGKVSCWWHLDFFKIFWSFRKTDFQSLRVSVALFVLTFLTMVFVCPYCLLVIQVG